MEISRQTLSQILLFASVCIISCGENAGGDRRNPRGGGNAEAGEEKSRKGKDGAATEGEEESGDDTGNNDDPSTEEDTKPDPVNNPENPETGTGINFAPVDLPAVNGPCPEFIEGRDITFNPKGIGARKARVWIGPEAATKDGPLVFYFQGTGMDPTDATWSLGTNNVSEIKSMGGIVVAPYPDQSLEYPWFYANGDNDEDDLLVIDEIVACAIKEVGIDTRRIHATGLSAGGMLSSDISQRRANYFASVSPHSGGFASWNKIHENAEPKNKMAIMIFHGGTSDNWENRLFYKEMSEKNVDLVVKNGGFAMTCDHGLGHRAPKADGANAMWQFFKDHPWNAASPYKDKLPAGFPSYCKIGK